jgi:hypothetical protein
MLWLPFQQGFKIREHVALSLANEDLTSLHFIINLILTNRPGLFTAPLETFYHPET